MTLNKLEALDWYLFETGNNGFKFECGKKYLAAIDGFLDAAIPYMINLIEKYDILTITDIKMLKNHPKSITRIIRSNSYKSNSYDLKFIEYNDQIKKLLNQLGGK